MNETLQIVSPRSMVQLRAVSPTGADGAWLNRVKNGVATFFSTASASKRQAHRVSYADLLPERLRQAPFSDLYAFALDGRIVYVQPRNGGRELFVYDQTGSFLTTLQPHEWVAQAIAPAAAGALFPTS